MPRVPFVPTVDVQVGGMVPLQAQQTRPMQNFAPQQMQQMGQAVQQLGGVVSDYAMRVQNEVDSANIKRHDNILADEIERIMHDPKSGYLNQVGKSAVDNRQVALDALAQKQKDIEKGLQNPLQRQIWAEKAQQRIRQASGAANEHYTKQAKVWEIGESQVRAGNFARDMLRTAGDGTKADAYRQAKAGLLGEADRISELSGHPIGSAQYNEARLQATTKAHAEIVRDLAKSNPTMAKEHLDSGFAAGEIAGEVKGDLEGLVGRYDVDDKAQKLALALKDQAGDLTNQKKVLDQLYLEKKIDVRVYDSAWARMRSDDAEDYEQKTKTRNEQYRSAVEWLTENRATVKYYEQIPAEDRAVMEASGVAGSVRLWLERGGNRITTNRGIAAMTQSMKPEWLMQFSSPDDIEARYVDDLEPNDLAALVKRWHDVNGSKAPSTPQGVIEDILWREGDRVGIVKAKMSDNETHRWKRMRFAVTDTAKAMAKGGPVTEDIVREAFKMEYGRIITLASGDNFPVSMTSPQERSDGAYNATEVGMDVLFKSLTPEIRLRIANQIAQHNEAVARWNAAQTDSSKRKDILDPEDPGTIANVYAKEVFERETAAREAREKAEAERVKTYGRYSGRMQDTFGSPYGR